jgi:hypothetical protein
MVCVLRQMHDPSETPSVGGAFRFRGAHQLAEAGTVEQRSLSLQVPVKRMDRRGYLEHLVGYFRFAT